MTLITDIPSTSPTPSSSGDSMLITWIATAISAVLITLIVGVTILVLYIIHKQRRSKTSDLSDLSDEVDQYDYINPNHLNTPTTTPNVPHRMTPQDQQSLGYIDIIPSAEQEEILREVHVTADTTTQNEPEYLSITGHSLPATGAISSAAQEDEELMANAAYVSSIVMTDNVAYPAFREN